MNEIIYSIAGEENTMVTVRAIGNGYAVGIYDADVNEYPFGIRIFPYALDDAKTKAIAHADSIA